MAWKVANVGVCWDSCSLSFILALFESDIEDVLGFRDSFALKLDVDSAVMLLELRSLLLLDLELGGSCFTGKFSLPELPIVFAIVLETPSCVAFLSCPGGGAS